MGSIWNSKDTRRRRSPQACNTCRERRTKCDGQRPKCSFCLERGRDCFYPEMPDAPPTPLELEISLIWERLNQITTALGTSSPKQGRSPREQLLSGDFSDDRDMIRGFPFMILQNESFMALLGLEQSFSLQMERMERRRDAHAVQHLRTPSIMVAHERAFILLNIFAENIHIWYPVLHASFTTEFVHAISNVFPPSPESCLALLVLAIGTVVEDASLLRPGAYPQENPYIEAALEMLPCILAGGDGVRSAQCFLLFSVYFLCCIQPCRAHDFVSMASYNLLNDLQNDPDGAEECSSILGNCYWVSLLIESEILVQLDIGNSGIWDLNPIAPMPISCNTWTWPLELSEPLASSTYPDVKNNGSINERLEPDLSYFIAEMAMRKMLQRCTWSVRECSPGSFAYAPIIAAELERQIDEWHRFLPERHSFRRKEGAATFSLVSPQAEFLRAQYYAFKVSIYWPAVYEAYDLGGVDDALHSHCCQFFESYVAFIRSAARAVQVCKPNLWTLCTSVFTISMAALLGSTTPCLVPVVSPAFIPTLRLALQIFDDVRDVSPSLADMGHKLEERASHRLSTLY